MIITLVLNSKQISSTSRYRRQNRQHITITQAGCQTILEADVVIIDVYIDEAMGIAIGNKFFLDSRILLIHVIDDFGNSAAFHINVFLLMGEWPQYGWNNDCDGHKRNTLSVNGFVTRRLF